MLCTWKLHAFSWSASFESAADLKQVSIGFNYKYWAMYESFYWIQIAGVS